MKPPEEVARRQARDWLAKAANACVSVARKVHVDIAQRLPEDTRQ